MHTARTHGRLYPGWRLPFMPTFVSLEQRFNAVLASQIDASLSTLLSTGQKSVHPDPNESTLLMLSHSASTLHSLPVAPDVTITQKAASPLLPSEARMEPNTGTTISTSERDSEEQCREDYNHRSETESTTPGPKAEGIAAVNAKVIPNRNFTTSSEAIIDTSHEVEVIQGRFIAVAA
jgi:hypothetical protein